MDSKLRTKCLYILFTILLLVQIQVDAKPKDKNLRKLDSYFQKALKDWQVPGMAIAIVKDGKISWDDRVKDHLPYFQLYDSFATDEMRFRDLLSHRSGLGTYSGDLLWYGTNYSAEEVVKRIRHLKPKRIFRSQYGYSNIMFLVADEVVKAVSGMSWSDFVQQNFFDQLGMNETVTSVSELESKSDVANPHKEKDGKVILINWYNWDSMAAAGGIISSIHDMSNWLLLQLNRGHWQGNQIFSENTSRTMWTPHISFQVSQSNEKLYPTTHFNAYGLGWNLMDY